MSFDISPAQKDAFPIPEVVPIFPLPTVVFFPETYLPLHIFEPRYREMIHDSSRNGRCIGMALLREGWEDHYHEAPDIYPIGCVGRIMSSHKLSDGRYNIVLQGLQRCRYDEQSVRTTYRQARVIFHDLSGPSILEKETRHQLEEVARDYLHSKNATELCQVIASEKLSDSILVHNLSAGLDLSPVEKQFLLESDNLTQQARRLIDLIRFKISEHRMAQG